MRGSTVYTQWLCVAKGEKFDFHFMQSNLGNRFEIKKKLAEVKGNEKCVLIGTLFKKMELKPCILKEISEEVLILKEVLCLSST